MNTDKTRTKALQIVHNVWIRLLLINIFHTPTFDISPHVTHYEIRLGCSEISNRCHIFLAKLEKTKFDWKIKIWCHQISLNMFNDENRELVQRAYTYNLWAHYPLLLHFSDLQFHLTELLLHSKTLVWTHQDT